MPKLLAFPALILAAALPHATAHAQLRPATEGDVGTAISACVRATGKDKVDSAKLAADGWAAGTMEKDGKAIASPVGIYGKTGNGAMIMTTDGHAVCIVTARIRNLDAFPKVVGEISSTLGGQPVQQKNNEYLWATGPVVIQLAPTGSRQEPSIRAGVIAVQGEKE